MVATLQRLDAVPSEAQMKLMIGQTLSMPFAYNSPVIILNFEVDEDGGITGRFKDANRPRVFEFELDGESVNFKPFNPGRMDSSDIDVEEWEQFSDGYSFRVDAAKSGKKAQCVKPTSYNCGSVCINVKKNCKSSAKDNTSRDRLKKLNTIAKEYKKAYYKAEEGSEERSKAYEESWGAKKKAIDIEEERRSATKKGQEKPAQEKKQSAKAKPSPQDQMKEINAQIKNLHEQWKNEPDKNKAEALKNEELKLSEKGRAIAAKELERKRKEAIKKMEEEASKKK